MGKYLSEDDKAEIWDRLETGESLTDIGAAIGRGLSTVCDFVSRHGRRRPKPARIWSDGRLSLAEREEISRGLVAGLSFRAIATGLGRAPSTVSREVNINGGRDNYRAVTGDKSVRVRVKRPKKSKISRNQRLKTVIEAKLAEFWSPRQIVGWLNTEHTDLCMRVSHESIYLALYAGELSIKSRECLRTSRPFRRRRNRNRRRNCGVIKNPVMIGERPASINERIELGRWEGDLIIGHYSTALATLVERVTRYTILVQLPGKRTMDALNKAIENAVADIPVRFKRSLTWDQGKEIAGHPKLAASTGMKVYLCEPNSPWQRGTNGLIRQWFPRSTNFYKLDPKEINIAAKSLNNRPRKTLNWATPAQAYKNAA